MLIGVPAAHAGTVTVSCTSPVASTSTSALNFNCSAKTTAGVITTWTVYDNNVQFLTQTGNIATFVKSANDTPGSHNFIIKAWDSQGSVGQKTINAVNITAASSLAVSCTSPVNGGSYPTPVHFACTATSPNVITAWTVYVNNVSTFTQTTDGATLTTDIAMATGAKSLIVRAWDSTGAQNSFTPTITVVQPTDTVTVTPSAPAANASVNLPVHFAATATSNTGSAISNWKILIDGAQLVSLPGAPTLSFDAQSILAGSHSFTFQATDAAGTVGTSAVTANVLASTGTGGTTPVLTPTTTLATETANNTAACPDSGPLPVQCTTAGGLGGFFHGTTDHGSRGTFLPPAYNTTAPHASPPLAELNIMPKAGNIAKNADSPLKSMIYPGFTGTLTTKVVDWDEPWFNNKDHIAIGKITATTAAVKSQADDMIARGYNVLEINYFSQSDPKGIEAASKLYRDDLDSRCTGTGNCPLLFAFYIDQGSFKQNAVACAPGTTCTTSVGPCPTSGDQTTCISNHLESQLYYLNKTYFGHPSHWNREDGRPIVAWFICESCWGATNWTTVWNNVRTYIQGATYKAAPGGNTHEPLMLFRGPGGFSHLQSDGAYGWVPPQAYSATTGNYQFCYGLTHGPGCPTNFDYSTNFYNQAATHPTKIAIGGVWAGFNDTNATWGFDAAGGHPVGRIIARQCGQVWVNTWALHPGYTGTNQIYAMGVSTWNDYEEGSAVEAGIDSCYHIGTVTADSAAKTLSWNVTSTDSTSAPVANGAPVNNTIDHFKVFISTNGTDLALLQDNIAPNVTSLDLSKYNLAAGTYKLYVKMVGKNHILNDMNDQAPTTFTLSAPQGTGGGTGGGGTVGGGGGSTPPVNLGTTTITTPGSKKKKKVRIHF